MHLAGLLLLLGTVLTEGAADPFKILVYQPKFAISHINFVGKVADTLIEAGHDVTVLINEMDAALPDGTKMAKKIERISPAKGADHMNTHFMVDETDMFELDFDDWNGMMENARHNSVSFCLQCRRLLTTPGLVDRLRAEKFDAVISENLDNCGIGLFHVIGSRALIAVSSTIFFTPGHAGLDLSLVSEKYVSGDGLFHSDILSRFRPFYTRLAWNNFIRTQNAPLQRIFEELHPGTPAFEELMSNAAVILPNSEPLMEAAMPTLSKIVPIGGLNVGQPRKLGAYWSSLLSLRPKTVFVSFGSIAKSVLMKRERKRAILEAFSAFPDTTFVWKYENATDAFALQEAARVPNVALVEWAPQLDLLADRRLTLFITHGGMASCQELARMGVPALMVPIFGDQLMNAAGLAHNGVAEVFSKFDMSNAVKIRDAIARMLGDSSYKSAAVRLRDQLSALPTTPAERLVKHVEFAARFGASRSLRPTSLDMPLVQYYGLDLAAAIIVAICAVITALSAVLRCLSMTTIRIRKVHHGRRKDD